MPICSTFEATIRIDSTREFIVGEDDVRADKDTIGDRETDIEGGVVLDFDIITNGDIELNIAISPNDTVATNAGTLTNLHMCPYPCPFANLRERRNISRGMNRCHRDLSIQNRT